jgi:hypothetical protein
MAPPSLVWNSSSVPLPALLPEPIHSGWHFPMTKPTRAKKPKKWIAGATGKPGTLHRQLGVPSDQKIPTAKLKAHDKGNSKLAKRARLAETLRGLKHRH